MVSYKIEGLDCAHCALKIETALRKIEGFENASINFSTQTVRIPSGTLSVAQDAVSAIEEDARIVERSSELQGEKDNSRAQLARICLSTLLFLLGIIFTDTLKRTPFALGEYAVFLSSYLIVGYPVLLHAGTSILKGRLFDEMFLMSIATIGAVAIHQLEEAVGVMLFYAVGEWVQSRAVQNSRRSIAALMSLRPDNARVVAKDGYELVDPDQVEVGTLIQVRSGERIPLDGVIVSGESRVDTSALTGESVPRIAGEGDTVLSGFVVDNGTLEIRVTKKAEDSQVARILSLVEEAAAKKAPTERFITKVAAVYTPLIVSIALAVAFIPPLFFSGDLASWVYRALVILVISCPCALVISVPLGYFGGIGAASKRGILLKGAHYIDLLKSLKTVVFDKTGTLTRGNFKVVKIYAAKGIDEKSLLGTAAAAEAHSLHPVADSIREAYRERYPGHPVPEAHRYHEEKGLGVIAEASEGRILAGSVRFLRQEGISVPEEHVTGTVVAVSQGTTYLGYVEIADEVKPGVQEAVRALKQLGVEKLVMLTGDREETAASVAAQVGIDSWYASLLPHEKVERLKELKDTMKKGTTLAFVGDGMNDAPVLMMSDIGISMGALGSDAAIEAADIVLMDDRMEGLAEAVGLARRTRLIVLQNIIFALAVKGIFLAFGAFGLATMWEAVIADVGVALLAVLNAARILRPVRSA